MNLRRGLTTRVVAEWCKSFTIAVVRLYSCKSLVFRVSLPVFYWFESVFIGYRPYSGWNLRREVCEESLQLKDEMAKCIIGKRWVL